MKRINVCFLILIFIPAVLVWADHSSGGNGRSGGGRSMGAIGGRSSWKPVVINMSRPSSGSHNRNFPSQQNNTFSYHQPSYGRIQRGHFGGISQRTNLNVYSTSGMHAAVSIHHHPYSPGYVRKKLKKLGVKNEPNYITDRAEIIHTDRSHSSIAFPRMGPAHFTLKASTFSIRRFNDPLIRNHMALVNRSDWRDRIEGFDRTELQSGRYYWHVGEGFNYCHYKDGLGYHWWGWYMGNHFFWNRYFGGRWWWYDSDFNRWCFWNEGFWWWQDPYHVGDLYCYNDDTYIPTNSSEDQVVVQSADGVNFQTYVSPDGKRMVKVATDTQDAFLYDTANPPTFNPIYLASGVEDVQFSNTNNGRPLEIILKLNDGSYDVVDGQGVPYGPGVADDGRNASPDGAHLTHSSSDVGNSSLDSTPPSTQGNNGT